MEQKKRITWIDLAKTLC